MKAYVIKNENDYYYYTLDEEHWDDELYRAFMTKDKELAEEIANEENEHKEEDEVSCQVVEITICEGDAEEENRVLKKALQLACETIHSMMPDKPLWICGDALAKKYNIPNTPTIKDYDYFIQQAKESEKDE